MGGKSSEGHLSMGDLLPRVRFIWSRLQLLFSKTYPFQTEGADHCFEHFPSIAVHNVYPVGGLVRLVQTIAKLKEARHGSVHTAPSRTDRQNSCK